MGKIYNRKLGICATAMTTARIPKYDIEIATNVRDDLEKFILDCDYLDGAPFDWVTISLRYGLNNDEEPCFETVNQKYGDLPLAIEIDSNELIKSSRKEMRIVFETAALKALIAAGRKYNLSIIPLETRLKEIRSNRYL